MKTLSPLKSILSFLFTVTFLTNSFAQTDSTAVSGCTYSIYDNYNELATNDDGSCVKEGCIDELAVNYDSIANTSDSTCYYLDCMDEEADNYNPEALVEGYCVYFGCTDDNAPNYDAAANTDDDSCQYMGCIDANAFNFDVLANTDDGSCYPVIKGCTDELAHNYVAASGDVFSDVNTSVDSLCMYLGCTYDYMFNYDSTATIDDFSFVDVEGLRVELSPTIPQWALDLPVEDHPNDIRTLARVINMLGQKVDPETSPRGTTLLYLFNDGTVEKKIH